MNFRNNFVLTSCVVLGTFFVGTTRAALKPTGFPQTFQDVSFSQRNQVKQAGYEPYKDASAYVIPKFIENDDGFYDELCKRDKEECCRRKPDHAGCQPQIGYELYGGDDSKCNPKLPKSYRTDQGATISCVPTRNKSVFLGWCTDAARNPADCAMSQTIPVGEKDDKFFWAKWDCVAPAVKRGEQCVCNDPNMDDNCMCSGDGMYTTNESQCECVANTDPAVPVARIENKRCVCIDSSMDINTNCTTPISTLSGCSDEDHMDNDCNCLPIGKASPDLNGKCQCIDGSGNVDPSLDIDNNCEPQNSSAYSFRFWNCRARTSNAAALLNDRRNGRSAEFGNSYCKTQFDDIDDCISRPDVSNKGMINKIFDTATGIGIALRDSTQMYNLRTCPSSFNNLNCLDFDLAQNIVDTFVQNLLSQKDAVKNACTESKRKWFLLIDKFDGTQYVPYKTICIGGQCPAGTFIEY